MATYNEFKKKMLSNPDIKKELSERTGITQADISRIEKGVRNPSLGMVKRLAKEDNSKTISHKDILWE